MGQKNSIFDMKLKAKEWQWELGREAKHLDKEIAKIQKDEAKLQDQIRLQAEKGNVEAVQLLAKSVVKTRKAVQRLEKTKASMEAVKLQLTTHMASISTSASIRLSSDIMRKMNTIARIPEISETMKDMRMQMAQCADAEDSIEEALREDGEEYEAATEVQKVLEEMALDQLGPLSRAAAVPSTAAKVQAPEPEKEAPQRQLIAVGESAEPAKPQVPPPQAPQAPPPPPPPPAPAGYAGAPAPVLPAAPAGAPAGAAAGAAAGDDDFLKRLEAASGAPTAPAPGTASSPTGGNSAGGGSSADDDLMKRLELLKKP
ncbi:chmp3 [Symbiodinium sp. CCMP2456]|nr:chmp3 [Symbiodinium sp. CCMP2456]